MISSIREGDVVILNDHDCGIVYVWRPGNCTVTEYAHDCYGDVGVWTFAEEPESIDDACKRARKHLDNLIEQEE